MRVAVTGATGGIGRWVVRELRTGGHEVLAVDRRPADEPADVVVLDLADPAATLEVLRGVEAVVHLAAVPGPRTPEWEAFDPNMLTTYHVLEAVRAHGIGRVVMASSIWAYGYNPPCADRLPARAPLLEEDTVATVNGYGLSKRLLEQMGREYAAAVGCQVVCMRYPWVVQPHQYPADGPFGHESSLSCRAELWSYADVRDVALACRLAVERRVSGFAAVNIGAADTRSALPSAELLRRHAPGVEIVGPIAGHQALYSIERARALLGYEPRCSWRSH